MNAAAPRPVTHSNSNKQLGSLLFTYVLSVLVLTFGLIITLYLWDDAKQNANNRLHTQFLYYVDDISGNIIKRMETYEQ